MPSSPKVRCLRRARGALPAPLLRAAAGRGFTPGGGSSHFLREGVMSIACPLLESSESSLDRVRAERARTKRPASPKRVAANRRNSRRSTGPRTPQGKARASRNALKHGLCAGHGPLPSECAATFNVFLNELEAELRPRTALQRLLFPQIANLLWNVQRLPQAQRDLFVRESGKAAADDSETLAASEVLARRFSDDPSNGFVLLGRYERSMQNALLRLIRQFHSLQKTHATAPHADGERPCPPEGSQPAWSGRKAEQQRRWFDEQVERVHRGLPVEGSEYARREVERLAAARGAGATKGGDAGVATT